MQPNGQASARLRTVLSALEFNELRVLPESVMMGCRTFAELEKVVGFRHDLLKKKKEAECIKLRPKEIAVSEFIEEIYFPAMENELRPSTIKSYKDAIYFPHLNLI